MAKTEENSIKSLISKSIAAMRIVLSKKLYFLLFVFSFILFIFLYLVLWNPKDSLLYPLSYAEILTSNAISLVLFSFLSALIITLLTFSFDIRVKNNKTKYSLFSFVPAFLISSSQCCPPLIFSLSSATLSFGLSLVSISSYIKIASFLAMVITFFYLGTSVSEQIEKCACENN